MAALNVLRRCVRACVRSPTKGANRSVVREVGRMALGRGPDADGCGSVDRAGDECRSATVTYLSLHRGNGCIHSAAKPKSAKNLPLISYVSTRNTVPGTVNTAR